MAVTSDGAVNNIFIHNNKRLCCFHVLQLSCSGSPVGLEAGDEASHVWSKVVGLVSSVTNVWLWVGLPHLLPQPQSRYFPLLLRELDQVMPKDLSISMIFMSLWVHKKKDHGCFPYCWKLSAQWSLSEYLLNRCMNESLVCSHAAWQSGAMQTPVLFFLYITLPPTLNIFAPDLYGV